jgi:subtilisin family serine protease
VDPEQSTYLLRGEIPDGNTASAGVFADPVIQSCITCLDSPAVGNGDDVQALLDVAGLRTRGLTGAGVPVAVVDTGINLPHLQGKGLAVNTDEMHSFTPAGVTAKPFQHPNGHGTMCAYDVLLVAPQATLLDHAVLLTQATGPTVMSGFLSDAVKAYAALRSYLLSIDEDDRRLVVTNSWGMFAPAWDFPPDHPGNYSDNPAHPFNVIVGSLEAAGADVLFAAGNCGRDCPDGRCQFTSLPICGANSHPRVLSIGGVDTQKNRVGYSSQGPGRLARRKPDVCAYTHFTGSDVFAPSPDSGTSAACPVAAGVVAAVRTKYSSDELPTSQLRAVVRRTAIDKAGRGFDFDYGYGIIDARAIRRKLGREDDDDAVEASSSGQQAAAEPVTPR